ENGVLVVRPDYSSAPARSEQASADNDFVVHTAKQQDARPGPERSAIAPDGVSVASTGEEVSHGAQIVRVRADNGSGSKGQFEPTAHIVRVNDSGVVPDSPGPASASGATGSGT